MNNAWPGDVWALFDSEEEGFSVDEDGPAGETSQQQDENPPLENHTYTFQVTTPICLHETGGDKEAALGNMNYTSNQGINSSK